MEHGMGMAAPAGTGQLSHGLAVRLRSGGRLLFTQSAGTQHGALLGLHLVPFGQRIGRIDYAGAGIDLQASVMQHAAADRHHPLTVALRVHPAHDSGEQSAIIGLNAPDQRMCGITRCAADRGGGVDAAGQLQRIGLRIPQLTTDAGGKVPQGRRVDEGRAGRHIQRGTQGFQPGTDVCSHELVLVMVLA